MIWHDTPEAMREFPQLSPLRRWHKEGSPTLYGKLHERGLPKRVFSSPELYNEIRDGSAGRPIASVLLLTWLDQTVVDAEQQGCWRPLASKL